MSLKGVPQTEEHKRKKALATTIHGMSHTPLNNVWKRLRQRCKNKNNKDYRHYGARGINVSKEWSDFRVFYRDMASCYSQGLEIERIDNDKGYSKENCRWATRKEQVNNTRRCRLLTFRGKTKNLSQWALELEVPRSRISARINNYHWTVERALTEPNNAESKI